MTGDIGAIGAIGTLGIESPIIGFTSGAGGGSGPGTTAALQYNVASNSMYRISTGLGIGVG
jgi:hypothetical protein